MQNWAENFGIFIYLRLKDFGIFEYFGVKNFGKEKIVCIFACDITSCFINISAGYG